MLFPRSIAPGELVGGLNLGLGLALILGAPERTSGQTYAVAMEVMPAMNWGLVFLLCGIICFAGVHLGRLGAIAVSVGAGLHTFWCLALITSAVSDKHAGLTGCVVYAWTATLHLLAGLRLARQTR